MTPAEAAARLGVPIKDVLDVAEHPAGVVVSVRSGESMLVTPTVTRRYVPEVDDPPPGRSGAEPEVQRPAGRTAPKLPQRNRR